ncbi:MAG TPA: HWE histidine kinase domain-containing protein [Phenylobacterium sp.]|uniref:HWE histidine kinase domain-containing protein n=1 Tax=Phenylobacterium sp. TaxID=1871053 RepID=UPI002B69B207|nr:HWE histidine kinase domain-containing protein [Phenylobacterium sp.]HSV01590.1 HWE histidine kinase domain-containing protein [Phenylobacterium sp.]
MTRQEVGRPTDRRRLELALEAAGLGEFEWDIERDRLAVSERMAAITGLAAGEHAAEGGRALECAVHPDDLPALRQSRERALAAGDRFEAVFRHVRPDDGAIVCVRTTGIVVRAPDGRPVRVTGVVQDITGHELEEERRTSLMAELDHRVKNVLAAVQALAYQTARQTTSLDVFLQNFAGRLKAMASANELLTAARWRGAAVDHLAAAELGAIAPGQTSWRGPELFLTPRAANALALAFHELAANAVKFGALSMDSGRVDVRWRRVSEGFELDWAETGGPRVAPPATRGFGSTLLEQVTGRELNGQAEIQYRPSGVRVRLRAGAGAIAPRPETVPEAPSARVTELVSPRPVNRPSNLKGARVLIVEDAVLLALELETGLSEAGAQVIGPAYELEEAMGLLDRPIDAAVLDANLNGRSVAPVAEALTARRVPFLFATGYGETGGAPGGFDAPVIRKPYDVTQVAVAVAELLTPA